MPLNVAQKVITAHLVDGSLRAGTPITLKIDQTLTQDATGTLVMLTLEALRLDRVRTEISVQYVDHNLLQTDNLNADDHLFLESACRRFGIWYSRPGNGISHVVHMQRFGLPGKSLLGSDSHTPAAGALGMLAIGAGGLDVALAMSGEPFPTMMPAILGVQLRGELPDWVSAKDVILEMLRRRGVSGGVGKIVEYFGPGLRCLGAMDRHVIANMGAELGATTTVFPSDEETRHFLRSEGRAADWRAITADAGCSYDDEDEIDLSELEPLVATPSSPGNVVKIGEIAGKDVYQSYIGSSANPGWRDFAVAAEIVRGNANNASDDHHSLALLIGGPTRSRAIDTRDHARQAGAPTNGLPCSHSPGATSIMYRRGGPVFQTGSAIKGRRGDIHKAKPQYTSRASLGRSQQRTRSGRVAEDYVRARICRL